MGVTYSPRIITNGLILYLDAANPRSYPGSGNTWTDLSGRGNNATISGTSVWNDTYGGQFDFGDVAQTTQYITLPHQAAQSTGTSFTMEFWMKPISTSTTKYFCSMATAANNNYYLLNVAQTTIGSNAGGFNFTYTSNEIIQFCLVRDGSDIGTFYKNGAVATNNANTTIINGVDNGGWNLNQEQDSVGGTFDAGQNYRGAFMIVKLYNRALTASEIKQNFNALRGRFGL